MKGGEDGLCCYSISAIVRPALHSYSSARVLSSYQRTDAQPVQCDFRYREIHIKLHSMETETETDRQWNSGVEYSSICERVQKDRGLALLLFTYKTHIIDTLGFSYVPEVSAIPFTSHGLMWAWLCSHMITLYGDTHVGLYLIQMCQTNTWEN